MFKYLPVQEVLNHDPQGASLAIKERLAQVRADNGTSLQRMD